METKTLKLELQPVDYAKAQPYMNGGSREGFREHQWSLARQTDNIVCAETSLVYCRESLCEYLRQHLRGLGKSQIDKNKLRLVTWRRVVNNKKTIKINTNIFRRQMMAGQKMVNIIEKDKGWPLTKIHPIETLSPVDYNNLYYYIVASKRWMKAPHMLSLFTLFFRLGLGEQKFKFINRVKTMKSLKDALEDMSKRCSYMEAAYIRTHKDRWWLVLDNYDKLFSSRDMEELYNPSKFSNHYFFQEGINSLCDLNTSDIKLKNTFREILKKHGDTKSK